jgi:phenylacetate-coenzyme A ligase PaaK-like adenylate-forming protein
MPKKAKSEFVMDCLNQLNIHHLNSCDQYRRIYSSLVAPKQFSKLQDFPFLPVRLFKSFQLKSVNDKDVIKVLTSSGTTSQQVSKIYLDKKTSVYQTKALVAIVQDFIGKKRLPMLIIDTQSVIKDRNLFSARGAGILGIANFGRDHCYVLDDQMNLDIKKFTLFLEKHKGEKILIFGFTFMVWQYLYKPLAAIDEQFDLQNSILIHSGGWKKLLEEAVDNDTYKQHLQKTFRIKHIYNFYGMVEQVGSIFMECEHGHLHAPIFSDLIIRDPYDWSVLEDNQQGIIEVISVLPHSYPGHVLLTEDVGVILGEDNCPCGRLGKYFLIKGRIPKAEVRGCSDTHAYDGRSS